MTGPDGPQNTPQNTPRYTPAGFGDIDDALDSAVQAGTRFGGRVLQSIADALQRSIDASGGAVRPDDAGRIRRRLDWRLAGRQGGWMTAGVFGWIFFGSFLIVSVVMAALAAAGVPVHGVYSGQNVPVFGILAAVFAPLTVGGGVLGWLGVRLGNYYARLRRCLKAMCGWTADLAGLARAASLPAQRLRRDLRKAAGSGVLGNAAYDDETDTFYLDAALRPVPPQEAPAPQAGPELSDSERFARQGADFLAYLRGCRGRLGADADAELDAMLRTCGAIMGFVHNHPEQLPRVRRFAEYYLPTTRKLLDTALGLGGADTENAQTIRRDITGILHTLNTAYANLYDALLQDVSLDVSAEIDTLETMLCQDGLTHGFASDFGARPGRTAQENTKTGETI